MANRRYRSYNSQTFAFGSTLRNYGKSSSNGATMNKTNRTRSMRLNHANNQNMNVHDKQSTRSMSVKPATSYGFNFNNNNKSNNERLNKRKPERKGYKPFEKSLKPSKLQTINNIHKHERITKDTKYYSE
eukprot:857874_1